MSASSTPTKLTLTVIFQPGMTRKELELHPETTIKALIENIRTDYKFSVRRVISKEVGVLVDHNRTLKDYSVKDKSVVFLWGSPQGVGRLTGCNCQGVCKCGNDEGCGCNHSVSMFRAKP